MSNPFPIELDKHQTFMVGSTLPEVLDEVASRWGNHLAIQEVEGAQRSQTWSGFREAVSRLRSGLENLGVRPGDKVGLMFRNQLEFPVCWFAVVEAGAAIVPLNPKYTSREVDFALKDADAAWLIGVEELIAPHVVDNRVGPVQLTNTILTDRQGDDRFTDFAALAASEVSPRTYVNGPRDVTNIQFTSGTTGLPKGCLLTHEYWLHLGAYGAAAWQEPMRTLADHPFYYMQNQAYFARALGCGGALYLTAGLSRRKFMGWLEDYQIDFAWIDEEMLDFPASEKDKGLFLKAAPVSAVPPRLHKSLENRFHLKAREWYASTEVGAAIGVPIDRDDLTGTGSMGFCLPHRESKVVDSQMHEVPTGEPGELCLRGPGMMIGYHNRPETNAELFLPGGWFRTGDIVRKTEDGQHIYTGRIKDMVRRSGENISAAEVESHLCAMPGILEVGVVPVPDKHRGEEVKAIVVLAPGADVGVSEVLDWAKAGLASFKVPRYIEFRDHLPRTASGKIWKSVLRDEEPITSNVIDSAEASALNSVSK